MTFPRNRKTIKKVVRYTTDLDDYEHESAREVQLLMGVDRAKLVRAAINLFVDTYHSNKSICRDQLQQDLFGVRKRA